MQNDIYSTTLKSLKEEYKYRENRICTNDNHCSVRRMRCLAFLKEAGFPNQRKSLSGATSINYSHDITVYVSNLAVFKKLNYKPIKM